MDDLESMSFEVMSPSDSISFTTGNTPKRIYGTKENATLQSEIITHLKCDIEETNFSPKSIADVCFCSETDNEILKGDIKSTPDRPKAFSCSRRRNFCYFSSESPKGILRSVPVEFGIPNFCNQRTLSERFEFVESQMSVSEIWSNISLNSCKTMDSVESENSDISSHEMDIF